MTLLVFAFLTSAAHASDWSDAMGEGSGVDRGASLEVASGGADMKLAAESALRAAISENIAQSYNYSAALNTGFNASSTSVQSAPAGDDGSGGL